MDLQGLIESQFGVKTSYEINPITGTALTTVTKVLNINPNRLAFIVMNMGASAVYLSPSNTVAVGNGIIILPGGGGVTLVWNEDFNMVGLDWYAIADGANSDIYVMEIVSYV